MADLSNSLPDFDANEIEPNSFEPVPAGTYPVVITESSIEPTSSGNGKFVKFTFQITSGEFQNRKLWSRLNIVNPNPAAVEIAKKDLASICRAVGVLKPTDTSELHNRKLSVKAIQKPRTDTGEMTNEIKAYMAYEEQLQGSTQAGW